MSPADLRSQYDFFFGENAVGQNIGFYGWELAPNKGIKQLPEMRTGFEQLMQQRVKIR